MAYILVNFKTYYGVSVLYKLKFFIIIFVAATIANIASADSKTYVARAMDFWRLVKIYVVSFSYGDIKILVLSTSHSPMSRGVML